MWRGIIVRCLIGDEAIEAIKLVRAENQCGQPS